MKRIIITIVICISVVLTSACESKSLYYEETDSDIEVCTEECNTIEEKNDDSYDISEIHKSLLENYYASLGMNYNQETIVLNKSTANIREDMLRNNPRQNNPHLFLNYPPRLMEKIVEDMVTVTEQCDMESGCNLEHFRSYHDVENVEYQYNKTSGHYYYEGMRDNSIYVYEEASYNFEGDSPSFVRIEYFPGSNGLIYMFLDNNIYYQYNIGPSELSYSYVNLHTNESIHFIFSTEIIRLSYYNHDSEYLYRYNYNSVSHEVTKYNAFEKETSLTILDGYYYHSVNFHFVDGWNKYISSRSSMYDNYGTLYKNDDIVFDEYKTIDYPVGEYIVIEGHTKILESEMDDYSFTQSLNTTTSKDELLSKLNEFIATENPLDIIPNFDITKIQENAENLLDLFNKKYIGSPEE